MDAQAVSWYCGMVRAEALIIGGRISGYRYVTVKGCGKSNPPNEKKCWNCGREKKK